MANCTHVQFISWEVYAGPNRGPRPWSIAQDGISYTGIGTENAVDALEVRKVTLASIVAKARPGIRLNEHIEGDGETVFRHACKLGLERYVRRYARTAGLQ